ncbi:hypothetical protein V6N12_058702 [Hibiscus sabdariffa]|uniref:Uncharacterized protein n=1 Tax=Hibiscus sabdariffa TaxID=183260 RepID=A0ABR2EVN1_9ROSI
MTPLKGRIKDVDEARKTTKLLPTFPEEWEKKKKEGASREVQLPCQSQTGIAIESSYKKRKSKFSPIAKSFNMNVRAQLDEKIARMFYISGLPFNLARIPHYQRAFTFAATHDIAGYVPHGYNKL